MSFPFSTETELKLGPNIQGKTRLLNTCQFTRRAELAGLDTKERLPLRWMWIVNEFKAEVNRLRKLIGANVNDKLIITVYRLSELHKEAIAFEWKYLYEECQLSGMKFSKGLRTSNATLPSAIIEAGRFSDEAVPISIAFYLKDNKKYSTK